jgi:hypothetical protein
MSSGNARGFSVRSRLASTQNSCNNPSIMNRSRLPLANRHSTSAAFSLSDLLFVLAALALLTATALSHQNIGPRTERLVCGNNLRQIGVAFQEWSDAFDDKIPWQVRPPNGGTGSGSPLIDNAWYHFAAISNQLPSPSVLACPSDSAKAATRWDFSPSGFLNPSFRNNALSYLVGCHAEIRLPITVLCADRNLVPDTASQGCSLGFTAAIGVSPGSTRVTWSGTNIHFSSGNVLLSGGNVLEVSSTELKRFLTTKNTDTASDHYLLPR